MEAETQAARVIGKFGGLTPMHRATGFKISTINNWQRAGFIPERVRPALLQKAREAGVDHTPFDYIAYLVTLAPMPAEQA